MLADMKMLTEQTILDDQISVDRDGNISVREATTIMRGDVPSEFPPSYHRYVLHPGDDLTGKSPRIVALANSVWTSEVVAVYLALKAK